MSVRIFSRGSTVHDTFFGPGVEDARDIHSTRVNAFTHVTFVGVGAKRVCMACRIHRESELFQRSTIVLASVLTKMEAAESSVRRTAKGKERKERYRFQVDERIQALDLSDGVEGKIQRTVWREIVCVCVRVCARLCVSALCPRTSACACVCA